MNKIWILCFVVTCIVSFSSCRAKKDIVVSDPAGDLEEFEYEDFGYEEENEPESVYFDEMEVPVSTPTSPAPIFEGKRRVYAYNVVVGSLANPVNAVALRERMRSDGYDAFLVDNPFGLIRVVVYASFNKGDALRARKAIMSRYYPYFRDAWIMMRFE
jgi:hypothetical protein